MDGFIKQWGTVTAPSSSGTFDNQINFKIPFIDTNYRFIRTNKMPIGDSQASVVQTTFRYMLGYNTKTTTHIITGCEYDTYLLSFDWIAEGY